ncbi:Nuclear RNA export factor 1 [Collichthys lucidus]|uniref:Nuclear RNA export factor 1 n=1 Tax=Collichthys lucidus TaxID=240159 RepID=A0A4U5UE15_COLLU|nr:Nuclear RNA export factor 1 [Collichthys lucidus]
MTELHHSFAIVKTGGPHKGRSYDRSRRGRQRGGFGGPGPRSRLDDTDGDVTMSDNSQDNSSQHRYNPYGDRPFRKGGDGRFDKDRRQGKGGGRGGGFRADRGGGGGRGGVKARSGWYKVTYHVDHNRAHFFLDDSSAANALHKCSHKITDADGYKVEVHVNPSAPPSFLLCDLKPEHLEHLKLKSDRELDKLKGLKLVELWLNRNPLCDLFKDQASYISAVRQRFPRLLKLDGNDLPAPIGFDVETPTTIPSCKGSCFGSDEIKAIILRFLQQYYSIYDSGDRQPLLDAYHDGASLSLTTPYSTQNPSRSSLGEYHKDSRNLKRLKDSTIRFRLLKHTRLNVVAFLNELPKTQHDIASFTVDVNTYTNTLLSFTVSGVFKEVAVDGKSRESTMAFSRVFITVPAGNTGLCIVNDQLFIRMATTEEIRRAFVAPAPTPSSSPVPTLTAPQQEMLTAFSQKSGMNLEWSQKCLQDNDWDFNRAAQIFTQLKTEGKIPDVAFIK